MKKKEERMICYYCKMKIDKKERYASLVSYDNGKISNQDYWHAECWKDWLNSVVEKRLKHNYNTSMELVKKAMAIKNSQEF